MILEIPVYHCPDGSRIIGQPDPRHGVKLGRIALALLQRNSAANQQKTAKNRCESTPCECLSCQTGRPDYPCLIEDTDD